MLLPKKLLGCSHHVLRARSGTGGEGPERDGTKVPSRTSGPPAEGARFPRLATVIPMLRFASGLALAAAVGLVVGALTASAQGWLGDGVGSLANSAGPWALAGFAVALLSGRLGAAVVWSTLTLVTCELGYVIATEVRGGSNAASTVQFWVTAAVLAGPPLGVAAAWARSATDWFRAGAGAGVIGGVLAGEGAYGLTEVADTTNPVYWAVEIVLGVAATAAGVAWVVRRPVATSPAAAACIGVAALAALVVYGTARLA